MAKNMIYPERVNRYNIEKLKALVLKGPEEHPGANNVEKENGMRKNLLYADKQKMANDLRIGDIVERHMENDDIVLFNRQPSLHRVSIMAHRVKVMPNKTLRFNECVCTPYNADFDGDEMNIHLPQTEEARAEARILMDVKNNLLIPRCGDPLVAATQDFLTASYLVTQKDVFFNRGEFMKICAYFADANEHIDIPPPTMIKPIELWTGKQIISVLLRPNKKTQVIVNTEVKERNYSGKREFMCPKDGWVMFKNSELLCGNLCKTTMGSGSKTGLFYSLIRDNSVKAAAACMLRVSKFSSRWLTNYGMSIGISDVTP
jgi:DNA-directed RNA polymerase III subunit RPC1